MTLSDHLKAIRERAEKATPGPFEDIAHVEQCYWLCEGFKESAGALMRSFDSKAVEYAEFLRNWETISHVPSAKEAHERIAPFLKYAREDIPKLLTALEKCRKQRDMYLAGNDWDECGSSLQQEINDDDAELAAILEGK